MHKLILIGSGPFEEKYVPRIRATRSQRLHAEEREEFESLLVALGDCSTETEGTSLARLGALLAKTDVYDPLPEPDRVDFQPHVFRPVWREAEAWRGSGKLLDLTKRIACPVVAIHGDYDPHPADGVREPLSAVLDNFRFILLKDCGHKPWIERRTRERFFRILEPELR